MLGVVRMFQPVHGYDVRRELVSWHAEEWANVAPGSIYNALKSLARDGLLQVEGTDQVGARPERTTYKITMRGEAEMMELLRETLWQVQLPVDPLVAALSLMSYLDRKELVSALEGRAAKIKGDLAHAQHVIDAIDDIDTPLHVRAMMGLLNARMGAELAWSEKFRAELAKGIYRTKQVTPCGPHRGWTRPRRNPIRTADPRSARPSKPRKRTVSGDAAPTKTVSSKAASAKSVPKAASAKRPRDR